MTKELSPIEELKEKYSKLQSKYTLPGFKEINEIFEIEDVDVETEFLLKKIRIVMSDKISNYIRFIDLILNPSNSPIFLFKLVKKLDGEDRDKLVEIYEKLGSFEIQIMALDLNYSEKSEADFIKKLYNTFKDEIKDNFSNIVEKMDNGKESSVKVNGSYFG